MQVFTKKTHLCTSLTYVDTSMCNFWHVWTCPSGKFPLVWAQIRTMRCVHCKTTCVYITFRLTKTCICVTINTTLCFPPTFPSIYLNSHNTTWLFLLTNPFQYPTINIRNHVWVHWFDWCEGVLDLLNVKTRLSKQNVWLTRSCPCANLHIGGRVCNSVCNLSPNCSCFISTNMFPHKAVVY